MWREATASSGLLHERWAGDATSGTASPRTGHCEGGVCTECCVPVLWPSRVLGYSSALRVPGNSLILATAFGVHPRGASTPLQPGVLAKVESCGLSAVDRDGWPFLLHKQAHRSVKRHHVGLAAGPPLGLDSTEVSV